VRAGVRYQKKRGDTGFDGVVAVGGDDVELRFNGDGVTRRTLPITVRATLTQLCATVSSTPGAVRPQCVVAAAIRARAQSARARRLA
jgi:hypothetical protein